MPTQTYDEIIEAVAKKYEARTMTILRAIRDEVRACGMASDDEPFDLIGDDYNWGIRVWRTLDKSCDENCIDIRLEIAEARDYDGDEDCFGINFGIDIVEWGGRILGGLSPYNYTDECWVDARDEDAVEERFAILEQADITGIPDLFNEESSP